MFDVILPSEEIGKEAILLTANAPTSVVTDFSLQRSRGMLDLAFSNRNGRSYPARTFQQGALKVRFPNVARGDVPEVVILNTAGGLAGDDRLAMQVQVDSDASATITSQACEKIYRALGKPAQVTLRVNLDAGACLEWLPQPMIFFDGACLERHSEIEMVSEASLLMVEGVVFGRSAMGEAVKSGSLSDFVSIRRDGRPFSTAIRRWRRRVMSPLMPRGGSKRCAVMSRFLLVRRPLAPGMACSSCGMWRMTATH